MKSYNDIFKRILEIIKLSEDIKTISGFSLKNFKIINHFMIYKNYVDEFRELLNSERTCFLISSNKQEKSGRKNYELLKQCKEKISKDVVYKEEYIRLYKIVASAFKHSPLDLYEYSGYYVLKEDYEEFINLCKHLKIGPSIASSNVAGDTIKDKINQTLRHNTEQYKRIKKFYDKLVLNKNEQEVKDGQKQIEIASSVIEEITGSSELISEDSNELETIEKPQEKMQTLNCDFREIIFLGMSGSLKPDMIVELKGLLTTQEFDKLLKLLVIYKIYSEDVINEIKLRTTTKFKSIKNIDELVAYFAVRRGIYFDSLKSLIPYIGMNNYHYLIDELFKYGTIDISDYKKYLIENNLLPEENSRKK